MITKIDLAEKGIYHKITGNELELKFNPIVVRNRTQDEIDNKDSWEVIKKKEYELLASNDELKQLPDNSKGTEALVHLLMELQKNIWIEASYTMEEKFQKKLNELSKESSKIPASVNTTYEKNALFKTNLKKMNAELNMGMENNTTNEEDKKFNITSRIRELFDTFNKDFSSQKKNFFSESFCEKVEFMIKESRGLLLQNFLDPKVFNKIIISEIKVATKKYKKLTKFIDEYMSGILSDLCKRSFSKHPNLLQEMLKEINKVNATQKEETENLIKEFISCETTIPFTSSDLYFEIYADLSNKVNLFSKDEKNKIISQYIDGKLLSESPFVVNFDSESEPNDEERWCLNLQLACISYWVIFEGKVFGLSSNGHTQQNGLLFSRKFGRFARQEIFPYHQ